MKESLLNEIRKFYRDNQCMTSIRYLAIKLDYKSHNSIYKIMKELEQEGYLVHNKESKKWSLTDIDNNYIKVKALNDDDYLIIRENKKNYLVYKIKNNRFINKNIICGDYLIVEKTNKLENNTLGLFIYNNSYHIMNYNYIDGFYILDDGINKEYLYKVKIIGKVIGLQRRRVL